MNATHAGRWWRLVLLGVTLTLLVIFRGPLMQWFSVGSLEEVTPSQSHPDHAHDKADDRVAQRSQSVPSHRFSEDELAALRGIFAATEEVRIALSQDRLDSVPAAVNRVRDGLDRLAGASRPSAIRVMLAQVNSSARDLEMAGSPVAARTPYAALSQSLFRLAEADTRLQEGWHAFFCPMAEEFQKWFQGHTEIQNPYMGQKMLACGSTSDWATAAAPPAPLPDVDEVAHYTCSMHPSVRQQTQGTCPICNMDLTGVSYEDLRTGDVLADAMRRQRIGVRTVPAVRRALVRQIRAVGEVAWDESRVRDVTARVDGWVEDLRVSRVGDAVEQDATLLRFYSPDLLATQREMLAAPRGGRLAELASERLHLWGMSRWAIRKALRRRKPWERISIRSPITGVVVDKRVNEGAHVAAGALLYRVVDPGRVWVLAEVFEQDLPYLSVGQRVEVTLQNIPLQVSAGEVAYVYPSLSPVSRTARVRVELDNADGVLRPGMFANLSFEVELGEQLAVPTTAVIFTGSRRLVFVDKGEGRLRPVEVQVGARTEDWLIITGGLSEGDVVVSSGVFLLAAESRIRSAADYWDVNDESR